jgi:esterase/lipase superfamily enzyme
MEEVLPLMGRKNNAACRMVDGCSLGGYHAAHIAFRHPECFNKVVSMSARYDLTFSSDAFPDLLNGYMDENIYYHMPSMYLPNLAEATILDNIRKLDINFISGTEDPFFANNRH